VRTQVISASALAIVLAAFAVSGCGGGSDPVSPFRDIATSTDRPPPDRAAELRGAIREAIQTDHRDSIRALWTNRVGSRPAATAGPALAELRRSVQERRRRKIRVRMISERFRILDVRLDPSYAMATATVLDHQHVRPYRSTGRPLGRAVKVRERARLELRRMGGSERFVVWKVRLDR
jgi:hypothetical protein